MMGREIRDPEGKLIAILKTLNNSPRPLGSYTIVRRLQTEGITLNERTVRYHLKMADARGYTQSFGRGGRAITSQGKQEIKEAMAERQVGSVLNKLKLMAYQTTFDPEKHTGQVPVNLTIVDKRDFNKALAVMQAVCEAGFCVSSLAAKASEGEKLGGITIPYGKIGLATVCSVAVNGVLLKAGIPTEYKFGGLLEIRDGKPRRFTAIIDYAGTSLDPSEEFIRSRMTDVNGAVREGNGRVLGVFRTIPQPAKTVAEKKIRLLQKADIGGVYALSGISEPLFQIPIEAGRAGMVQLNGLNPAAAVAEAGISLETSAGVAMMDYRQLKPIREIPAEIGDDTYSVIRE